MYIFIKPKLSNKLRMKGRFSVPMGRKLLFVYS